MELVSARTNLASMALVIVRSRVKRFTDYLIAVPAILVTAPLMVLMFLAIKLIDPGPAIYLQEREGRNGRIFKLIKFRSMYTDADERLNAHFATDPERRFEWEQYFKLEHDPRVLPFIGGFMRRASLDELPNLFNVVAGAMSIVGPRPFPRYHLDTYDESFLALRRIVRPGITGLWQLERGDAATQRTLDTLYIANWSLSLDARILARTVPAVFMARKARY